jgi:penicillin-binding protein 2
MNIENTQGRILWVGGVLGGLLLLLWGGLIYRQLIQYEHYKKLEERQSLRRVLLPAPRGVIYDRNGVVLASNRPKFSLIVYLGELRGEFRREQIRRVRQARQQNQSIPRATLQRGAMEAVLRAHLEPIERFLGKPVALDIDSLEKHLYQQPLMPYPLLENLSREEFARLTELLRVDAPIQLQVQSLREYPQGDLASHLIGFVSMRQPQAQESQLRTFAYKTQVGISGVEKSFEDTLQGKTGYELWLVDPAGFRYEPTEKQAATPGSPLTLTIDSRLQRALEDALGSKTGAAAAIDVNSGEVLALVSKPSYNPNELLPRFSREVDNRIRQRGAWINRAIQGLYPPGSTFKIITALAALNEGALDINEQIDCASFLEVGKRKFPENRKVGHGLINLATALERSSNVFFYHVGLRIGPEAIMRQAQAFGLDKPTGIELPGETARMLLPTPRWKMERLYEPWYGGDTANVSIGQGDLLITPLQMACFTASLARGALTTPPTLVKTDSPIQLPRKPYSQAQAAVVEGDEESRRARNRTSTKNAHARYCRQNRNGAGKGKGRGAYAGVDNRLCPCRESTGGNCRCGRGNLPRR